MNVYSNEVDLTALESVRSRLSQLHDSIIFTLKSLNPQLNPENGHPMMPWPELQAKFNVLMTRYFQLSALLNDPHSTLIQSYIVSPLEPPATDQHVQNLSVLLRTKLAPDLERQDEEKVKEGSIELTNTGPPLDDRNLLVALKLKISMHDALCAKADEIFENLRDEVPLKARIGLDDQHGQPAQQQQHATEMDALENDDCLDLGTSIEYLDKDGRIEDNENAEWFRLQAAQK